MKQVPRAWDNNNMKVFHPTESKLLPVTDNVKYYEKNILCVSTYSENPGKTGGQITSTDSLLVEGSIKV